MKRFDGVRWLLALCIVSGLIACDHHDVESLDVTQRLSDAELKSASVESEQSDQFLFGFDLRRSPQEDARQYLPFLHYLERVTGYRFRLRFTPSSSNLVDDLGQGSVHFAAIGADTYLRAHGRYGVLPLARGLNDQNRAEYRSCIVTLPESPIREIPDLAGKRFAFGSVTSTQGHLIPRIVMDRHGIALTDLAAYAYTGSHQQCADAVISGRFDACGMQDTLARELATAGHIRILHASRYYPSSGIAANRDLPPQVIERVTRALLDFRPRGRDAEGLYNWDKTEMPNGFIAARDVDYAELHKWLVAFGLAETGQ